MNGARLNISCHQTNNHQFTAYRYNIEVVDNFVSLVLTAKTILSSNFNVESLTTLWTL